MAKGISYLQEGYTCAKQNYEDELSATGNLENRKTDKK